VRAEIVDLHIKRLTADHTCKKKIVPLLLAFQDELEQHVQPVDLGTLAGACARQGVCGHLAIYTKPYLDTIIVGQKTI
jgi:hypothetical protein